MWCVSIVFQWLNVSSPGPRHSQCERFLNNISPGSSLCLSPVDSQCEYTIRVHLHLQRPRSRPRPMESGSMIMFRSVYTESRLKSMQIFIGSVRILLVSVSVSVSV